MKNKTRNIYIKIFVFFLIFRLILMNVNALPLTISNSTITETVNAFNAKSINISILNNQSEDVYNISLSPAVPYITFSSFNLNRTQSINKEILILTNAPFAQTTFNSKIIYYKYVLVPRTPLTVNIDLLDDRYNPSTIDIYQDYTINFTNKGSILHSVTKLDNSFDYNLNPGQSTVISFSAIENFTIYDKSTGYTAQIRVLNKTQQQLSRNVADDRDISFILTSNYQSSNITITSYTLSYTINASDTKEGILRVFNPSSIVSYNITLTGKWITFSENYFNVNPNEENLLTYAITANPNGTIETNTTHNITISARGENTNEAIASISVFVPYKEISTITGDTEAIRILEQIKALCIALPTSPLCGYYPNMTELERIVFKDKYLSYNYTPEFFHELLLSVMRQNDTLIRADNRMKLQGEKVDNFVNNYGAQFQNMNMSLNYLMKREQSRVIWSYIRWIGFFVLIVVGTVWYFIYKYIKKNKGIGEEGY